MIGNLVKTAALAAVTFGAGAALGGATAVAEAAKAGSHVAKAVQYAQARHGGRALASTAASTAQLSQHEGTASASRPRWGWRPNSLTRRPRRATGASSVRKWRTPTTRLPEALSSDVWGMFTMKFGRRKTPW